MKIIYFEQNTTVVVASKQIDCDWLFKGTFHTAICQMARQNCWPNPSVFFTLIVVKLQLDILVTSFNEKKSCSNSCNQNSNSEVLSKEARRTSYKGLIFASWTWFPLVKRMIVIQSNQFRQIRGQVLYWTVQVLSKDHQTFDFITENAMNIPWK